MTAPDLRRADPRYPQIIAGVLYRPDGSKEDCAIVDLSAGGAGVIVDVALSIGSYVQIELPGLGRSVAAKVIAAVTDDRFSLRFDDLSLTEQVQLTKLLQGAAASH